MIEHALDTANSTLYVRPKSPLEADEAPTFPGWDSLAAMAAHIRFVRDHHRHIKKIALVTDAAVATVAKRLASHFVAAEIKHFPAGAREAAQQWILRGR
jgi:SpoIIAA-like